MTVSLAKVLQNIDLLERAANALASKLGPPLFVPEAGKGHHALTRKDSFAVQVLKAVRVVSGLHACAGLLGGGFFQEAMVIFRTIDDFLGEILFLEEAHGLGKKVRAHQDFVDQFFSVQPKTTEEMLSERARPRYVSKQKIRASETRVLGGVAPGTDISAMTSAIDDVLSGFVHGNYPHIMEMYDPGCGRFRMTGLLGTPRMPSAIEELRVHTHGALSIFVMLLRDAGFAELADEVNAVASTYESNVRDQSAPRSESSSSETCA